MRLRLFLLLAFLGLSCPGLHSVNAAELPPKPITRPYDLNSVLNRAEELFKENNFREAVIFYFESLELVPDPVLRAKVHFRIGECLEGVRRFDFAAFHYKQALSGNLPEVLSSRALMKLKHLPKLAQHEEAVRLYNRAMGAYRRKDIRNCIDDYLQSLKLEPSLMGQDTSGLLEDSIQYLTFLSESKEKEPSRLLKLATLLELRGDTEKAIETLKQILIIYPDSPLAREVEEKVEFYTQKRNTYVEFKPPKSALEEVLPSQNDVVLETELEFRDPGVASKELKDCAYTFRASNEQGNVPDNRFEVFMAVLGKGENQREFLFRADEGIPDKKIEHDDGRLVYLVEFKEVDVTTAYIQDIYGEGNRTAQLFRGIRIGLTIRRK